MRKITYTDKTGKTFTEYRSARLARQRAVQLRNVYGGCVVVSDPKKV